MSLEGPWAPVGKGSTVRVVLLDFKGSVRHSWEASLERSDNVMMVLRAVARKELRFDEVTIEVRDQVVQYFPRNEWFYIQEYLTPSGRVKGWYCNIATPPLVEGSTITTQDLIADVFVWPDCRFKVLDLDELEERKGLLQPSTIEEVYKAKDRLVRMIERRDPPFNLQGQAHL